MSTQTPSAPVQPPVQPTGGSHSNGGATKWIIGIAIVGIVALFVVTWLLIKAFGPHDVAVPSTAPSVSASPSPTNTTAVVTVTGYELHYYSRDPGVAAGYYGPACIPLGTGNPTAADSDRCKADLLERVKHDPILATSVAITLNIPIDGITATMTEVQKEVARQAYADKLATSPELRKALADKIAVVVSTIPDLKLIRLDGWYTTTVVDKSTGKVSTITVKMDPTKKYGLTGTMPSGTVVTIKTDCGFQPSHKTPPPPAVTPTPTPTPSCGPHQKCNNNVPTTGPTQKRGPGNGGSSATPGTNETPGPAGCGVNAPCPSASPRPPQPTPSPTSGWTQPPATTSPSPISTDPSASTSGSPPPVLG